MKLHILIAILAFFLVQPALVSALTIDINVPAAFSTGEQIYFNYTLTSGANEQITFTPHVLCQNAPVAFLQEKTTTLVANIPYQDTYADMTVNEQFEPQTCIASVQISSPVQMREEKTFSIDTLPSFSFDVTMSKKVFLLNENIQISYTTDVANPIVTATLTKPDGTTQPLTLPTTIVGSQIGTYTLDVTASKAWYKTVNVGEQFGVIASQAVIADVSMCNADGTCNANETAQNCPQDCSAAGSTVPNYMQYIILFILVLIIIALIALYAKARKV